MVGVKELELLEFQVAFCDIKVKKCVAHFQLFKIAAGFKKFPPLSFFIKIFLSNLQNDNSGTIDVANEPWCVFNSQKL